MQVLVDRIRLRRTTYYTDVFLVVLRTYRTVLVRTLWWACMSRCGSAIGDPKVHVRIGEFWDLDFFLLTNVTNEAEIFRPQ